MVKKTRFLLVIIFILFLSSCASLYTNKSHYNEIDYHLQNGDNLSALNEFVKTRENIYKEKDKVLYYLEEGMLYRYAGDYQKSNESLTKAEYAIEELITKSISKGILSGVLNDNALDYSGEDYEDIYINIFKALNYLQLNLVEEALVEIRRVNYKLDFLESKYQKEIGELNQSEGVDVPDANFNFHNDAIARYLGIIAYRLDGSYDDSRIEKEYFDKSYEYQPAIYNFPKPAAPKLKSDKTLINLFSYSGFAPEKVADTISINGHNNSIYLGSDNDYIGFTSIGYSGLSSGINLKLQFPRLVSLYDPVSYVEILIDGISYGYMDLIEDVNNVAIETFKVKQPLIIGKTVIRAVSKAIISEVSEDLVTDEFGEGFGLLTSLFGSIFMQVTENSDLRASRYFPSKIRALEIMLEPGFHDISFVYYNSNYTPIYQEDYLNQEINKTGLNLFESTLMRKQ